MSESFALLNLHAGCTVLKAQRKCVHIKQCHNKWQQAFGLATNKTTEQNEKGYALESETSISVICLQRAKCDQNHNLVYSFSQRKSEC